MKSPLNINICKMYYIVAVASYLQQNFDINLNVDLNITVVNFNIQHEFHIGNGF